MGPRPYKHARIAADLREQIQDGTYQPGQRLPSIPELRRIYGVGDRTARAALQQLISEGIAVAYRSYGTYVTGGTRSDSHHTTRLRRTHSIRRRRPADAPTTGETDLTATPIDAMPTPPDVALTLDIDPRAPLAIHQAILSDQDGPIGLRITFIPGHDRHETAAQVITHTYARHTTEAEAETLGLEHRIVLVQDETTYSTTGPLELTRTLYRADVVRLADQYRPQT